MRSFLLLLFLCAMLLTSAQKLHGVWEGKVSHKKFTLNLRLELIEQQNVFFGILYTRGSDKGMVYGCDYFVSGNIRGGHLVLTWQKVQRAIAMSKNECSQVDYFDLLVTNKDSITSIEGDWYWEAGGSSSMNLVKKDSIISEMTVDEISEYMKKLYESYEVSGIKLTPESRLTKRVYQQALDSIPFIVEISVADSSVNTVISAYVNENLLADKRNLQKKPLRLKFDANQAGEYELIIVNESDTANKFDLQVKISQAGETKAIIVTPTFTINPAILFTCK